ncbi:helix-turn-helix transcriptional regulator [Anaerosporobacter faecicola]|uniref:helix-turn-helix transcriptional regulator n=1 Tax=Anaerosporobacter faecicola TaxID=2718714 RepID=UPI0014393E2A|nr:YafY family protein [Anaerosporobacter faecicola]
MKIDRIMAITTYLLNHGKTSAQKLAEEFEVSSRTIMRDMDTLGQAGIPIQSTYGVDGGYEIMGTYVMEKQLINAKDYEVIVTALKGLASAYANKNVNTILDKMNLLVDERSSPIRVDLSIAKENHEINQRMHQLEEAIREKKVVRFTYTNNEDQVKELEVEPIRMEYRWYNWYLIAYYEKYHDYCMFKLIRMEQLQITQKKFSGEHKELHKELQKQSQKEEQSEITQQGLPQKEQQASKNQSITVRVLGKKKIKAKCKEYLHGEISKEYENGDFEFCFTVPENEFYWYGVILSFENNVKVLEPQSLIDRILGTCKAIKQEYKHKKTCS